MSEERKAKLMMLPAPPGTCPKCAVKHDPLMPHNKDSLFYQYAFYAENNRWPTWADAMAHCPQEIKDAWIEALKKRGIAIDGGQKEERA